MHGLNNCHACEWDEFAIGIVMIPNKLKSICIKFVSNAANTTAEPIEQEYTHIPSNWIKYQIYCTEIRLHSFDKFNQNKSNFIKFIQILNPLYFSYDKISANTASSEPRTSKFQKVQNTLHYVQGGFFDWSALKWLSARPLGNYDA